MEQLINTVCDYFVPSLIAFCVLFVVVLRTVTNVLATASRERSRREIAAYIAEGSMTPEQGEKLLRADGGSRRI